MARAKVETNGKGENALTLQKACFVPPFLAVSVLEVGYLWEIGNKSLFFGGTAQNSGISSLKWQLSWSQTLSRFTIGKVTCCLFQKSFETIFLRHRYVLFH